MDRDRPCCHQRTGRTKKNILLNQDPVYEQNLALILPVPGGNEEDMSLFRYRFYYCITSWSGRQSSLLRYGELVSRVEKCYYNMLNFAKKTSN